MLTIQRLETTMRLLCAGTCVAEVYPAWQQKEARILFLADNADRAEVRQAITDYWPTLTIVWPEGIEVVDLKPGDTQPLGKFVRMV